MKTRFALIAAILLGLASASWADGELIYPWDNPPPAPGADCLDVPCVPCVFSLPGLSSLSAKRQPCKAPQTEGEVATVAVHEPRRAESAADN